MDGVLTGSVGTANAQSLEHLLEREVVRVGECVPPPSHITGPTAFGWHIELSGHKGILLADQDREA